MSESATDATTAAATPPAPAVSRIAFRPHAELPWLLMPEGLRMEVLIDAAAVPVPNTRPWFHGVISLRGVLLPVFDLATWAGVQDDRRDVAQIASVGSGAQACALRFHGMPMLLQVTDDPASGPRPGGRLDAYLGSGHDTAVGPAYAFDVARWLETESRHIAAEGGMILAT